MSELPSAGEVWDERYEVEAFVARGFSAAVFRARDLASGEHVALKILRDAPRPVLERVRQIPSDAVLRLALADSAIVPCARLGVAPRWYSVSPFVAQEEALGLLMRRAPLDGLSFERLLRETIRLVGGFEKIGLHLLDLTPHNLCLAPRAENAWGDLRWMDFGWFFATDKRLRDFLLSQLGALPREERPPADASQELFRQTRRLLYFAATGFDAEGKWHDMLRAHLPPPPLSSLRPELGAAGALLDQSFAEHEHWTLPQWAEALRIEGAAPSLSLPPEPRGELALGLEKFLKSPQLTNLSLVAPANAGKSKALAGAMWFLAQKGVELWHVLPGGEDLVPPHIGWSSFSSQVSARYGTAAWSEKLLNDRFAALGAGDRPIAIVIDDAHAMWPKTLEHLKIIQRHAKAPVLCLLAGRDGDWTAGMTDVTFRSFRANQGSGAVTGDRDPSHLRGEIAALENDPSAESL